MNIQEMKNIAISKDLYAIVTGIAKEKGMTETDVTELALHELFYGDIEEDEEGWININWWLTPLIQLPVLNNSV